MEEASRNDLPPVQMLAAEEEQQRLMETGHFLAEIGKRATLHALNLHINSAPEAPALQNLLGAVALMSTAGVQADVTWARVVHWVLQRNQGSGIEGESKSPPASEEASSR